jgi:hypothetical protein
MDSNRNGRPEPARDRDSALFVAFKWQEQGILCFVRLKNLIADPFEGPDLFDGRDQKSRHFR